MKKTLLTLLATAVALSASAARLTKRQELANRTSDNLEDGTIYDVSANLTLSASAGSSMLRVLSTNVVAINIKKGVSLTLNGGNATGMTGAGAAISVAPQATLYLVGEGTLIANGGAAADGGHGFGGNDAVIYSDAERVRGGAGGTGGAGGGGGASAIGGPGGDGGTGGAGGDYTAWTNGDSSGNAGSRGASGANGGGMGKVVILGGLAVRAVAGAAAASDGGGGGYGQAGEIDTSTRNCYAFGGGGGGGGARGQDAQYGIGGGGAGGAGGGGGGSGGTYWTNYHKEDIAIWGYGGGGGYSYMSTSGQSGDVGGPHNYKSTYGGAGGDGGTANTTRGDNGTLQAADSVNLMDSPSRTVMEPTALEGEENVLTATTITFMSDVSEGSAVGTAQTSLMFEPPEAPTVTKDGYVFLGYYTEDGVQIYDANYNCVYTIWPTVEDVTLYAAWGQIEAHVTFLSRSSEVGSGDFVRAYGTLVAPSAPSTTRNFCRFLGYFTQDEEGGVQVYDENCEYIPSSSSTWNPTGNVTLYAHWAPVTITFMSQGAAIGSPRPYQVSGDTVTPPTAPSVSRNGYRFDGYYRGIDKFYNENYQYVANLTELMQDVTLDAQWVKVYNINFVSVGATVGSAVYVEGEAGDAAPIPQRAGDYVFHGYYTDNGVQVFDASGALVEGALSGLPSEVSLYAHWGVPEGSIAKLVYRGQLSLLTGDPAVHSSTYTKKMHFRVYDSSESTTPLWTTGEGGIDVTVNKDGSFVQEFGDDTLAELLATGTVTHVGLAIGDSAMELKPRRELRPVAAVNHALTAEGAALDIRIGNLVTENALVAADATVSQLEVTGRVTAPGAGEVAVSPLTVGDRERTRLMRGAGVKAFSAAKPTVLVADTGAKLRGEVLVAAPSDGIALITSKAGGERALRCPAVVQYCRAGESVRAPTSEAGGLKVTFFPFIGSAR